MFFKEFILKCLYFFIVVLLVVPLLSVSIFLFLGG